MIYVECYTEEALVRTLTNLPRREVIHEFQGKSQAVFQISRRRDSKGLVDEDPAAIQPTYFQRLSVAEDLQANGLRVLRDNQNNNSIILLCPRFEEWVVKVAQRSNLDLVTYGLPPEPIRLHRVVNDDLRKIERLFSDLSDSDEFKALRSLLQS